MPPSCPTQHILPPEVPDTALATHNAGSARDAGVSNLILGQVWPLALQYGSIGMAPPGLLRSVPRIGWLDQVFCGGVPRIGWLDQVCRLAALQYGWQVCGVLQGLVGTRCDLGIAVAVS